MLAFATGANVTLSTASRADTGHLVFHANAGGGLACASCHAEGNDDGRVWNFACHGRAPHAVAARRRCAAPSRSTGAATRPTSTA